MGFTGLILECDVVINEKPPTKELRAATDSKPDADIVGRKRENLSELGDGGTKDLQLPDVIGRAASTDIVEVHLRAIIIVTGSGTDHVRKSEKIYRLTGDQIQNAQAQIDYKFEFDFKDYDGNPALNVLAKFSVPIIVTNK